LAYLLSNAQNDLHSSEYLAKPICYQPGIEEVIRVVLSRQDNGLWPIAISRTSLGTRPVNNLASKILIVAVQCRLDRWGYVTGRPSIEQDFGVSAKGMGLQSAGRAFRRTDVNENRHAALPCPQVEDRQKASRTSGKSLAQSRKTQQPPGKKLFVYAH